jgi:phosphatidylserine synthase
VKPGRVGANLATLANALLGAGAIVYTLAGNKLWGMLLLSGAIGFDGLDGILSRRAGGPPSRFGRVADSVADTVSFAVGPGVLVAVHTDQQLLWAPYALTATAVGGVVIALAIARLVYFTLRGYRLEHFLGASTPQTTLAIVLLVLLLDVPGYLGHFPLALLLGAVTAAVLMVLPIPYPKMRRGERLRLPMALTSAAAAVALVPVQFRPSPGTFLATLGEAATFLFLVGMLVYYIGGPFSVRASGRIGDQEGGEHEARPHP